jgi:hypothetical protein
MSGASDEALFAVCRDEGRALITLDHDFGQVLRFAPHQSAGIVVLELRSRATTDALLDRLKAFLGPRTAAAGPRALDRRAWAGANPHIGRGRITRLGLMPDVTVAVEAFGRAADFAAAR